VALHAVNVWDHRIGCVLHLQLTGVPAGRLTAQQLLTLRRDL